MKEVSYLLVLIMFLLSCSNVPDSSEQGNESNLTSESKNGYLIDIDNNDIEHPDFNMSLFRNPSVAL